MMKTVMVVLVGMLVQSSESSPTSVEIAPGVLMPFVNLGGVRQKPSNYSLWFSLGGRGVDTALMYGSDVQTEVRKAIDNSGLPRSQIFLTTKVPCCPQPEMGGVCNEFNSTTARNIEADLDQLGVDYVDLMLLHWPCDTMEQTISTYRVLEPLVAAGKAKAIGVSNFNASLIDAIAEVATVKPAINQCGFSIGGHNDSKYGRDFATRDACRAHGITYSAYSPLGGLSHIDVLANPDVKAVAMAHGVSTAQVALRWVVQQGIVAVTASTEEQYDKADLDIFSFTLTDREMELLSGK